MNKLDENVVLRLLREQRAKQLDLLREELDVNVNVDGVVKKVISPGLKVRTSSDGILFTVHSVGKNSIVLRDANGNKFVVTDQELEDLYELD